MRLLNVDTKALEEFHGKRIPRYSILSHTWDKEEVTHKDLVSGSYAHLQGYEKIAGCCDISRKEGYKYTWIDTCCIDKSSSAELSEAINSMFRWYSSASICYAYLSDVGVSGLKDSMFDTSRWFRRGWTLQELLGPRVVVFLNSTWKEIGTKTSLAKKVSVITGIDERVLVPNSGRDTAWAIYSCSIAQRMSWAAGRHTTRIEDEAYSLLGIFDINMPLLYGEGPKAFLRLQEQIIQQSKFSDASIFAWEYPAIVERRDGTKWSTRKGISGLLAESPACFKRFHDVRNFEEIESQDSPGPNHYFSRKSLLLHTQPLGNMYQDSEWQDGIYCMADRKPARASASGITSPDDDRLPLIPLKNHSDFRCQPWEYEAHIELFLLPCVGTFGRLGLLRIFNMRYHFPHLSVVFFKSEWEERTAGLGKVALSFVPYSHPEGTRVVVENGVTSLAVRNARDPSDKCTVDIIPALGESGYQLLDRTLRQKIPDGVSRIKRNGTRDARAWLFVQSSTPKSEPPFVILWRYKAASGEVFVDTLVFGQDTEEFEEARFRREIRKQDWWGRDSEQNCSKTSEVRRRLTGEREAVIKIRMDSDICRLIIQVEHQTSV